jgi:hypothetical protein
MKNAENAGGRLLWVARGLSWLYFMRFVAHFGADMKRIELFFFAVVWLAVLAVVPTARAAATNGAPDFNEVRDLLRSHLPGMTDAELNQAAVEGLVKCLRGRVVLLAEDVKSVPGTNASLLARSTVLEEGVIYLRAGRVADGLAKAVGDTYEQLASSNKINGVVLDLRFANGDDYPAAAATADLFLTKQQRLLDWGMGFVESKRKTNAISVPVAILVNA